MASCANMAAMASAAPSTKTRWSPTLARQAPAPRFGPAWSSPSSQCLTKATAETKLGDDGWVVSTADGSRSAQFEHTLAITDSGPEMLTVL